MSLIIVNFKNLSFVTSSFGEKIKKSSEISECFKIMGSHFLFFLMQLGDSCTNLENSITILLQIFTLHWEDGLEGTRGDGTPFNRFWIFAFRIHEDWHKGSTTKEKPWEWLRLFRFLTWKGEYPWFSGRKILFLKMVQDQMLGRNLKMSDEQLFRRRI